MPRKKIPMANIFSFWFSDWQQVLQSQPNTSCKYWLKPGHICQFWRSLGGNEGSGRACLSVEIVVTLVQQQKLFSICYFSSRSRKIHQNQGLAIELVISNNQIVSDFAGMDWQENQELNQKYENSESFRRQMDKIDAKFKEFEQQAFYSDLQQTAKQMILAIPLGSEVGKKLHWTRKTDLFIVIGAKQSTHNVEKIVLNLIHAIPRPKQSFTIIYINTTAHKNAFSDFMKMTELLPIQYFRHLDLLYVLQASFMSKALSWASFNVITSFLKTKTVHLGEFRELADRTHADQVAMLRLLPSDIRRELGRDEEHVEFLLANKAMKLVTMQDLLIKTTKSEDKSSQPSKNHHEESCPPLRSQTFPTAPKKPIKHQIEVYVVGQTGAPLALQMLIYYFNERQNSLEEEGIFRKSVSIDEQSQILEEIQACNYDYIETIKNPHIIANAIKRFLAYLLSPLIPYSVFEELMETNQSSISNLVVQRVKSLNDVRRKTLLVICQFFLEKVIPKEEKNKMGLKNISIVLGPCIMWSKVPSIKDLLYSQKIIVVTSIIFKQFVNIFGNKKERTIALRKSVKEFNKIYLQDRLGVYQSTLKKLNLKPCELTKSQADVIRQSRQRSSQIEQKKYEEGSKEKKHYDMEKKVYQAIIQVLQDDFVTIDDLQVEKQQPIHGISMEQNPKFQPVVKAILSISEATEEIIKKESQDI